MKEDDNLGIIEEELLLASISKWHPSLTKQYSPLELIEMELKILKDNLLNKSKHGQWEGIIRKLGFIQDQSSNLFQQSQTFIDQLEKNVKATQKQCNKRMQKIQKECLHREIKIKSMLDQQILVIVEQNKVLQVSDQQLEPFLKVYKEVEQRLKLQRKKQIQFLLNCQLQIQQFKSQNTKLIKQIKKNHNTKMLQLKKKLRKMQEFYSQKILELKKKREQAEKQILQIIEDKMTVF